MVFRAFVLSLLLVLSVAIRPVQSQSSTCPIDATRVNLVGIADACNAQRPDLCESCICFLGSAINDAGYDVRAPDFDIDACALENLGVLLNAGATLSAFVKVSNCPRDSDMFDCLNSPPPPPADNIQSSPPVPSSWLRDGNNSGVVQTFESLDTNVTSGSSSEKVSQGIVATISSLAGLIFLACVFMFVYTRCRARHKIELEAAYVESAHEFRSPITLDLKGVVCSLPSGRTVIPKLSASFVSGTLVGILGPSGCGKTTLMKAMHYGELVTSGFVQINDEDIDIKRHRVASVPQDPYAELAANLTVRETIAVSARLRLPWFLSKSMIERATTETMEVLGLCGVAESKIGDPAKHTLSGGEARRVSIATELVVDPQVILLDEPTSGLDAFTSSRVIATLRDLSRNGKLVIATIHQPSTKNLQLFDTMVVLGQTGEAIWIGSLEELDHKLVEVDMQPPPGSSTAEWILEVACDEALRTNFMTTVAELDKSPSIPLRLKMTERVSLDVPKSVLTTMQVLFWKALIVLVRDVWGVCAHFCVPVGISLILGGLYFNVDNKLEGFQNRMGATFFLLVYFALSAMSLIDLFNTERSVAQRQLRSRYYSHIEYVVSKTLMDWALLRIPSSLVSSLIFYFMMDLRQSCGAVLIFIGYIALFVVIQSNTCAILTYISKSTATATLGTTCVLLITAIFSGFLINVKTLPAGAAWVKYVSPFYYAWSGILANEMQGGPYLFNANFDGDLVVVPVSGQTYLDAIGVQFSHVTRNLYCMIALAVITYILAAVAFRFVASRN